VRAHAPPRGWQVPNAPPRLLTEAQTAEYLSVSVFTLQRWRSEKRYDLPFIKLGKLIRYRIEHLDAWLESHTVTNESN